MNQCSTILNHLMAHGCISSLTARSEYGVKNLSARVKELRYLGLNIDCKDGLYTLPRMKRKPRKRVIEEDDLFPDYNG